ncbi:Hypothetical protein CINCED_3A009107 [Cinara cedri]|uniref:Uncharacterized protein n=1 Tax=Cinara cedri TaxID=506608 RepID=A0A5E4NJW7_9HEMI|nr:Hypothetical protein CINCED_3A009107 [Cinara cedri]
MFGFVPKYQGKLVSIYYSIGQNPLADWAIQILDTDIQSINDRFSKLTDHSDLFPFLYNITEISDFDKLMNNYKDLKIVLTSSDGLIPDINVVELYGEIISLQKRFIFETCDLKSALEYVCQNKLIELYFNT